MKANLSATLTVMRKELRDFARDRRTFWLTLLLMPLLYPMLMLGMGKLMELRKETQLDKVLEVPVVGAQHAPNLVAWLDSQAIRAIPAPADLDARVRSQQVDVALAIPAGFERDWRAGKPARIELVMDSTRRDAEVPAARIRAALEAYGQTVGGLRLLVRGINPAVARPLSVATRDLATPEAKRGFMLSVVLPLILLLLAFIGGSHLAMDTTAGERERQSLEPLLATPAARGSIVSGKMLAASAMGIATLLLTLLSFKLSANLAPGTMRMMDVSFPAIGRMLLILLPLVLIGTTLLTFIAAAAKSMKEAQSQLVPLMLLPMLPGYALMAYPLKDTALWQYAVPFLSQNQLLVKVSRGEAPSGEQWGIYLAASLALAALLWLAAVWRYRQERLAISA